jgi:hypothetical protein
MSGYAFTPLGSGAKRRPDDFPRVTAEEQAARDVIAEQLVSEELATTDTENPDAQAALEAEYAQRFGKPAPSWQLDRKSTRLNSSHRLTSRMPSSA